MVNDWIMNNYNLLKHKTKGINVLDKEDIFNEVMLQFMLMATGKTHQLIIDGEANKYFMAMFKVNCFSKTSPYQRTYNKYRNVEFDDRHHKEVKEYIDGVCLQDFEKYMDKIDVFFVDKHIYKDYIYKKIKKAGYSIRNMSKETTIPKPTLEVKFKNIRNELKKMRDDEEKSNN